MAGVTNLENDHFHNAYLVDLALKLISVIARDRFGDFVSDQVVAPVRESSAQALGSVLGLMAEEDVMRVVKLLLDLLRQKNWQCRHGGLLGVRRLCNPLYLSRFTCIFFFCFFLD